MPPRPVSGTGPLISAADLAAWLGSGRPPALLDVQVAARRPAGNRELPGRASARGRASSTWTRTWPGPLASGDGGRHPLPDRRRLRSRHAPGRAARRAGRGGLRRRGLHHRGPAVVAAALLRSSTRLPCSTAASAPGPPPGLPVTTDVPSPAPGDFAAGAGGGMPVLDDDGAATAGPVRLPARREGSRAVPRRGRARRPGGRAHPWRGQRSGDRQCQAGRRVPAPGRTRPPVRRPAACQRPRRGPRPGRPAAGGRLLRVGRHRGPGGTGARAGRPARRALRRLVVGLVRRPDPVPPVATGRPEAGGPGLRPVRARSPRGESARSRVAGPAPGPPASRVAAATTASRGRAARRPRAARAGSAGRRSRVAPGSRPSRAPADAPGGSTLLGPAAAPAASPGQRGSRLAPAVPGAQVGVGGRRGGEPRRVAAVGPVRVRRGGDPAPGGADLVVGQVGAGVQAEHGERDPPARPAAGLIAAQPARPAPSAPREARLMRGGSGPKAASSTGLHPADAAAAAAGPVPPPRPAALARARPRRPRRRSGAAARRAWPDSARGLPLVTAAGAATSRLTWT